MLPTATENQNDDSNTSVNIGCPIATDLTTAS